MKEFFLMENMDIELHLGLLVIKIGLNHKEFLKMKGFLKLKSAKPDDDDIC